MNKLLVYSLQGCNKCEYLLNKLDQLNISYEKHVCEDDSEICDNLEEFTNCYMYPILKIFNYDKTHVYLAIKQTKESGRKIQLSHFDVLEWYDNLDSIVERTQALLK